MISYKLLIILCTLYFSCISDVSYCTFSCHYSLPTHNWQYCFLTWRPVQMNCRPPACKSLSAGLRNPVARISGHCSIPLAGHMELVAGFLLALLLSSYPLVILIILYKKRESLL